MSFLQLCGDVVLILLAVYMIPRLISAAIFQSKAHYERTKQHAQQPRT